jgi:hypothetical protein
MVNLKPPSNSYLMKNNYNLGARVTVLALTLSAAFAFTTSVRAQPPPGRLWYNGDPDFINGLPNERNTALGSGQFSNVYDNFNVTGGEWIVKEVFSDNFVNTNVTGATWEIRRGTTLLITGGTLVASGTTATPIVTQVYCGNFCIFEIKVTGLNVFLPVLPAGQFYWLNVTPIGDFTGRSFVTETMGANCIGTPCGNDATAFWNSNFFNIKWKSTAPQNQLAFSMGVNGTRRSTTAALP